jgi:hypothetical protein
VLAFVVKRKPKLAFALSAPRGSAPIKTVVIDLPTGMSFSAHSRLAREIVVADARGKHMRFSAELRHGLLAITLKTDARSIRVNVAYPAIRVSKNLSNSIQDGRTKTLPLTIRTIDTRHKTTRLTIKVEV